MNGRPGFAIPKLLIIVLFCFIQTGQLYSQWTVNGNDISNSNTGRVGVGTMNPNASLHIQDGQDDEDTILSIKSSPGTVHDPIIRFEGDSVTPEEGFRMRYDNSVGDMYFDQVYTGIAGSAPAIRFSTGNTPNAVIVSGGGNVGIGTTSPDTILHLQNSRDDGDTVLTIESGPANTYDSVIRFQGETAASNEGFEMRYDNDVGDVHFHQVHVGVTGSAPAMRFSTGNATDAMVVSGGGNVGIGTTNPQAKLHVDGDVTANAFNGVVHATYQDIAEWVPTSRAISPGMVVILDPELNNSVIPSTEAYDTRVAGVVSANPGIVLGEAAPQKTKIATMGRVKVRVDAFDRPIRIGDLLVTSGVAGTAMRSEPVDVAGVKMHRPGTLIGKALEPLASGQAEILVLLSLQ